jgi:membrane protease YdiL (CAAX protease family)
MTGTGSGVRRVFHGPFGVRAGWRILLWLLLTVALALMLFPVSSRVLGDTLVTVFIPALVAATAAGMNVLTALDRRSPAAIGFPLDRDGLRDSAVGFGLGGGVLGASVLLLVLTGSARWLADSGTVPEYAAALTLSLAQFAIAAAAEEVVFRGYLFQALVQGIGTWPAVLASSLLFAWAHRGNEHVGAIALANIFLAGVMLAVVYLRTRSLWAATAVHLGWNWMMSAALDFPVSGLQLDTPLYDAREVGADWWTGGAFGPEAGLAATLVLLVATAWMLRTPLLRESAAMRAMRPLVDDRIGPSWPRRSEPAAHEAPRTADPDGSNTQNEI